MFLLIAGFTAACSGPRPPPKRAESTTSRQTQDIHKLTGRIVQTGDRQWRFQPNGQPHQHLRLTEKPAQAAAAPRDDFDLSKGAGQEVTIEFQSIGGDWAYGVKFIGGPKIPRREHD
ncbi:MAG TPA: hypothetical protein VF669_01185 [Tepidisphaeraceae bacterium]